MVWLAGIVAVCLLGLAGGQQTHANDDVWPAVEGSWFVTVTPAGGVPPPFPALVTYAHGGGMVVTDGSFPPTKGNVYQGTWTRTGPRRFVFTFLGLQYTEGVHSGYVRVFETVVLDPSGNSYTGSGVFQELDLAFNVTFSEPDTTVGRRIRAR